MEKIPFYGEHDKSLHQDFIKQNHQKGKHIARKYHPIHEII